MKFSNVSEVTYMDIGYMAYTSICYFENYILVYGIIGVFTYSGVIPLTIWGSN